MDQENLPISQQTLLYDPMFASDPNLIIKNNPDKGFFGKIIVKKILFILVLVFFISISMYFSFRTVSKDVYTYKENGAFSDGTVTYALTEYYGDSRTVLVLDYVRDEKDNPDNTKPVTEIGRFAVNCNESLTFVYISETVEKIDPKAFFTCKNLKAFFVDENNPNYKSEDGVLFRCENGIPVEIIMFPAKNPEYRASLQLGLSEPSDPRTNGSYFLQYEQLQKENPVKQEDGSEKNSLTLETENNTSTYTIPDTVTVVNELCFAECNSLRHIIFNENITDIETMAFFKCGNLQEVNLPDSCINIGSDAFSSCKAITDIFIPASVKSIGHHAFHNCEKVSAVRMECSEDEAELMKLGQDWVPKYKKVFMTDIEIRYGEEREVK